ncbi:MAG: hypothetical protein P8Y85_11350 [Nitrospirota bacterium]
MALTLAVGVAFAGNGNGHGNGAPSGAHYNLNLIGVGNYGHKQCNSNDNFTDKDMSNNGHRIFVDLCGNTKIMLCESGVDAGCEEVEGFSVLDANGTDGEASFALPNPDPDGDGETVYSVFARALGKPGGSSMTTTCAWDYSEDPNGELVCSVLTLVLERDKGKSRFDNVTKYLLYIYADVDGDGDLERVPLFDDSLEGYYWDYDNNGLKLAQLRFYECVTIVPDPSDPYADAIDTDCY